MVRAVPVSVVDDEHPVETATVWTQSADHIVTSGSEEPDIDDLSCSSRSSSATGLPPSAAESVLARFSK